MKTFALKQISTGFYLTTPKGRGGRGGSHLEPEQVSAINPPRLFHSVNAAKAALGQWLRGKVTCTRTGGYDTHSEDWYNEEILTVTPVSTRIRADMLIVEVQIVLPDTRTVQ